jgi:thiopurine S-methyltransferase
MKADFWHNKWETNQIAFHKSEANPILIEHISALGLNAGDRVFLPLCGKTLDISWLLYTGYKVVGAELSEIAINDLFAHMDLYPIIIDMGDVKHYSAENIDIFVGDIFKITPEHIGHVDAIFDRAALVALPDQVLTDYAKHMLTITQAAKQLLITFEYDPEGVSGPPHPIFEDEVATHYQADYDIQTLAQYGVEDNIKGKADVIERVYLLLKSSV